MAFTLNPPVPPNIPEDEVYSIAKFNNYFQQLQNISSEHDDKLEEVMINLSSIFPLTIRPETIDEELESGIYFLDSSTEGAVPDNVSLYRSFLISVEISPSVITQYLFTASNGIFSRDSSTDEWNPISDIDIEDSLISESTTTALSANQGRILDLLKLNVSVMQGETIDIDNIDTGLYICDNVQVEGDDVPLTLDSSSNENYFILESFGTPFLTSTVQKVYIPTNAENERQIIRYGMNINDAWAFTPWQTVSNTVPTEINGNLW